MATVGISLTEHGRKASENAGTIYPVRNIRKGRRRDRLDLMMEVLKATKEPMRKTQLLYKTAMNHEQLTRCLDLLLRHGMIERTIAPFEMHVITENGRALLGLFEMSNEDI